MGIREAERLPVLLRFLSFYCVISGPELNSARQKVLGVLPVTCLKKWKNEVKEVLPILLKGALITEHKALHFQLQGTRTSKQGLSVSISTASSTAKPNLA